LKLLGVAFVAVGVLLGLGMPARAEVKAVVQNKDNAEPGPECREVLEVAGGAYRISLDTCETPDLAEWSKTTLAPVICEWYPRLVKLLPSDGFEAPTNRGYHSQMTGANVVLDHSARSGVSHVSRLI